MEIPARVRGPYRKVAGEGALGQVVQGHDAKYLTLLSALLQTPEATALPRSPSVYPRRLVLMLLLSFQIVLLIFWNAL